jgi:hypothetical protein
MWGVGVWAVLIGGVAVLMASVSAMVIPTPVFSADVGTRGTPPRVTRYPADSLRRVAVARDVFRTDRLPAAVAYDPSRGAAPQPDGPAKPQLKLTGVVWGDVPEAVIEGLPTASGPRVVRTGDVVGGVTIKWIDQVRVIAVGFDTTWSLTVREPWR